MMEIISIDLNEIQNGKQLKLICFQNGYAFHLKPEIVFTQYKNKGVNVLFCDKESLRIIGYFDKKWDFIIDKDFEHFALNAIPLKFRSVNEQPGTKNIDLNNLSISHILNKIDKTGINSVNELFPTLSKQKLDYIVNSLLNKINSTGYSSLKHSERLLLEKISNL